MKQTLPVLHHTLQPERVWRTGSPSLPRRAKKLNKEDNKMAAAYLQ